MILPVVFVEIKNVSGLHVAQPSFRETHPLTAANEVSLA
jgi:hypothetical protein